MPTHPSSHLSIDQRLQSALETRKENNQFRDLRFYEGYDFCSNDYLGLAQHSSDNAASLQAGSTGSRLISGHDQLAENFERDLANFHGFEHSLLFSSGYSANVGLLACVGQKGDLLILDSLIHASSIDGALLSKAKRTRFKHNDVNDLREKLEQFIATRTTNTQQAFVVVESLYSMDGDIAPLQELVSLCKEYNASLIVDEAHALGIFGEEGAGGCEWRWGARGGARSGR